MRHAYSLTSRVFGLVGFPILAVVVVVLFAVQWKYPLRRRVQSMWRRLVINVGVSLPAFAFLRLAFIPFMVWLAWTNEQQWHVGMLHWTGAVSWFGAIPWFKSIVGFLLLDWSIYVWHVLTHKVPLLWRFHLVHHTDLDLDLFTAFRFHVGEVVLSALFRGAAVVLTGGSPLLVLTYEIIFEACTNFHHSNWKLPVVVERGLNLVMVTPRMHGIHHSNIARERDTNWGTIFSFWDRIHRTLLVEKAQEEVVIGEAGYGDARELTVGRLLMMPFRRGGGEEHEGR